MIQSDILRTRWRKGELELHDLIQSRIPSPGTAWCLVCSSKNARQMKYSGLDYGIFSTVYKVLELVDGSPIVG